MTRSITIEDLYQIKFVSRPHISADGQRVAYVVTTIDENKHTYRSGIWVASVEGGEARRFTSGSANAGSPAWSPDGRWLAFVSDREGDATDTFTSEQKKSGKGKPQIWLMPTDGGEARQLTCMPHGAGAPVWSPDCQHLVFSAQVGPVDEEDADGKPLPKARVIDRLWYRLDGVGFVNELRSHLFLLDITAGSSEPRQITDGDWDDGDAAWSSDGQQLAFVSDHSEDRWRWPGADVYILNLQDQQLRRLTDGSLGCAVPSWSPDDKTIAFIGEANIGGGGQASLYIVGVEGEQAPVNISQQFVGSCGDATNSDIGDEHLSPAPVWSADGQELYALMTYRGATRIFVIPAHGADAQPTTLTPGEVHVRDFTADHAGKTLALLVGNAISPQEIFVRSSASSGELRRISHENDALLKDLTLTQPELISYAGADGWPMEGWIIKPHDFDAANTYPLIVEIHGGPHTQYGYGFFHEMQVLAAQGYVVFYSNPRGSLGYGRDFANAVRGAWGVKDSLDILLGMDEVLKQGYIDEQRLGVTGGSYGGFMTNWLVGHSERFKAAVTDRCVSNLASMFGSSDVGWVLTEDNLDFNMLPWESLDTYMHLSPIKYVQNMHTPLLIIHSEQDLRCSIEQSEQLFAALKWLGREVEFVRFEGQSHGLSRGGHPKLRKVRLQHIMNWFAKHL